MQSCAAFPPKNNAPHTRHTLQDGEETCADDAPYPHNQHTRTRQALEGHAGEGGGGDAGGQRHAAALICTGSHSSPAAVGVICFEPLVGGAVYMRRRGERAKTEYTSMRCGLTAA